MILFDELFLLGVVFVPLLFGLVPGFLPARTHKVTRWLMWLAVLGLAAWYGVAMQSGPANARQVAWTTIAVSAFLSLVVLIFQHPRRRRLGPRP